MTVESEGNRLQLHIRSGASGYPCPHCKGDITRKNPPKYHHLDHPVRLPVGPLCPHCSRELDIIVHLD